MLELLPQQILNGLLLGFIYVLVATGLTLVYGISGVVNLAHGTLFMLGAFVAYFVVSVFEANFFIAVFLAMAVMAGVCIIIERIVFRPNYGKSELNILLVSIGLMIIIENVALAAFGTDMHNITFPFKGTIAVKALNITITYQKLFILLITMAAIVSLNAIIGKTSLGKAMRATSQDKDAAHLMGIDVNRIFAVSFAISGSLAAVAGALLGSLFGVEPFMGSSLMLKAFAIVIFGGLGSVVGAIYGGLILGVSEVLGAFLISTAYKDSISFLLIIIILLVRPSGLFKGRH